MRLNNIIFFLLLPVCALADGVRYSEYTLDVVRLAFLVKVILYDAKKNIAKVEILKKYQKPSSLAKTPTHQEADDFNTGQTVTITMKPPVAFIPGRWVSAERYWDEAPSAIDQGKAFVVYNSEKQFEFSDYSSIKEKKFELFYDDTRLQKTLAASSLDDLAIMLGDRDFEELVVAELNKRKAIDAVFLEKISNGSTFHRVLNSKLINAKDSERNSFLVTVGGVFSRSSNEKQIQFLQFLANLNSVPFETKLKVYELFKQENPEIRVRIKAFLNEVKSLFEKNPTPTLLHQVKNLYLEFLRFSENDSSELAIEVFFKHLPEPEKAPFVEEVARIFATRNSSESGPSQLGILVDQIVKTSNTNAAWLLTEISLKNYDSLKKENYFNSILSVLFKSENLDTAATKNKILNYANPYLMYSIYPITLTADNKINYLKMGGLVLEDMDSLRLGYQKNQSELANKFTYYFDMALVVDIVISETLPNSRTLIHLKVHKKLGALKNNPVAQKYKNILNICEKAVPGETLSLTIDKESFELLTKLEPKRIVLATKTGSYQFLVFESSYEKQIESAFEG